MAYVPVASRSSAATGKTTGYTPVAEREKVKESTVAPTSPLFPSVKPTTQTTTPAVLDPKSKGLAGITKEVFTGGDDTTGGTIRNTVFGLPKAVAEVAVSIPKSLKEQFTNPSEVQRALEKGLEDQVAKRNNPIEKAIILPAYKTISRFLSPGLEPLAKDLAEIKVTHEFADKIEKGQLPASALDELAVLHKTAPQIVGDVAQAVLTAYAGGEAERVVSGNLEAPVKTAVREGFKSGIKVGTIFGGAQAASSGSKNPLEIAAITGTSGLAGGVFGAILSGAIPVSKEIFKRVEEAEKLYRSMTPEEKQAGFVKNPLADEEAPKYVPVEERTSPKVEENGQVEAPSDQYVPVEKRNMRVPLSSVEDGIDPNISARVNREDPKVVAMAEALKRGEELPAVPVYEKSPNQYELNKDGYHRRLAHEIAGKEDINIKVEKRTDLTSTAKQALERDTVAKRKIAEAVERPRAPKVAKAEDVLLKERLRNQERGAKAGFKEGYAQARESIIAQLTNKFDDKLESVNRRAFLKGLKENIKVRDFDRVKSEIVEYAKSTLPQSERGKFLTMVAGAKTQKDLTRAFVRIDGHAQEVVKKSIVADINKTTQKIAESSSVDVEYRNKIKELMSDFELHGHRPATIAKLEETKRFLESERAKGKDVSMPERVLEKLQILTRTPMEKLTVSQLEGLRAEIELLQKLGETKARTKEALYENEKSLVKEELLNDATALESKEILRVPGQKTPFKGKVVNRFKEIFNKMQKARLSLRPIDGLAEITGMTKMKDRFDLNFGNYLAHNDTFLAERDTILKKLKLNPENMERIGIYAAAKQEGGLEKLANSGISEETVNSIELTPEEKEYYDFGRKWFESDYPAVNAYMKDVYNRDVGKVENYVSFQTDFDLMNELEIYDRFGTLADEAARRTKTTEKGFTESRTGAGKQKIKVDFDKILTRHRDDVAYMLNMGRDTKMFSEIVNSPEMKAQLGDVGSLAWLEWLDLMARKGGADQAKQIALLDFLRRNVGAGVLPFKLSSALIQLSSFADAGGTIGGKWATSGAFDVATSREARKFVMNNFPEIKAAVGDDVAFLELEQSFLGKASQVGIAPLKALDGLMRSTTALGAYRKLAYEKGIEVDFANPDKAIIAEANKLVRQSQGSSSFKDQPLAITKGQFTGNRSFDKMLFQFQSFMLNKWENIERQVWREGFKTGNYGHAIAGFTWLVIVSAALEQGLRAASTKIVDLATGHETEQNDPLSPEQIALQSLGNVPIVGNVVNSLSYDSNPVPIIQATQKALSGGKQIITGKSTQSKAKGAVDATAGAANLLFGVPGTAQASTIAKNLIGSPSDTKKSGSPSLPTLPSLPKLPKLPKLPSI